MSFKLALSCCAVLLLLVLATTGSAEPKEGPISFDELERRGIQGNLGVRLGTIVEIEGIMVPNESRSKALFAVAMFRRIDKVNGRSLPTPALFPASEVVPKGSSPPQIGDRFRSVA